MLLMLRNKWVREVKVTPKFWVGRGHCLNLLPNQGTGDFPGGTSGKEPTCQCRRPYRCEFDPWVEKIPWKGTAILSYIFAWRTPWTEEPGGATVHKGAKSWT